MNIQLCILIIITIVILMGISICKEQFVSSQTIPSFMYPTDMQQPYGPCGWGYRDPHATLQTLKWEQSKNPLLMPKWRYPIG